MRFLCFLLAITFSGSLQASEIIYTPVNPNFVGKPGNASMLMSEAEAINKFKDPAAVNPFAKLSPLDQFNSNLQQFVLNQIAASVTSQIIDANGNLIPGTIETQQFSISIAANATTGGLTISTTDKTTGQTTSFEVR